ncbi:aldehyde dehydrogenase [Geomicrobium sp. JCM 19037]|uniref:aldehyde dehydrogenase n=1 Tax=Geomicrobium sp. JCM 19037 TaxID=1460634 RepID=UPI00045F4197|nr:aldehyde dehydrogenase [Geomicrobium sp. JCM 19037]GAK06191.1 aldehyde dehydrogenase [Geomicrobium sp. JCM 19037]
MQADLKTQAEAEEVLKEHQQFFYSGATKSIDFRLDQLKKLKKIIQNQEEEIYEALQLDLGKNQFETYATEIGIVLTDIEEAIQQLPKWAKPEKVKTPAFMQPSKNYVVHEPYGTVLIMGPFNYPFQLLIEPLIGAIAAGNCAVLKTSEHTPATSRLVKSMVEKIFYKEYIRVIEGGVETNSSLIHAPFDYIFFTGSTAVGKIVMEAAAKNLTPVTLELGGKSPAVVHRDANLKRAAERIVWGKLLNNGQTCIAPDYVLVHEDVKEKLVALMKKRIEAFYGTDIQHNADYGRIVNDGHFDRLASLIHEDADYIIYGGASERADRYIEPTLLDVPSREGAKSMEDEIFGPILPILTYQDLDVELREFQQLPKPLAFYFFSEDDGLQDDVMARASFGGGCVNDTIMHVANPHLPFGGVGDSGMGNYHGVYSFETFSHKKSISKRSSKVKVSFMYPPYKNKLGLIKKFLK